MGFLKDISKIFKKTKLTFDHCHKEAEDLYTFVFKSSDLIPWQAGQHGIFTITHKKIKKPTRVFSIASCYEENEVRISTKITDEPSAFKAALLDLKKGQEISMRGPIGGFYLKDQKPSLFIVGGVGMTPFRSMLKDIELHKEKCPRELQVLYIDSKQAYLYEDFLTAINQNTEIKVCFYSDRKDFYKDIDAFIEKWANKGNYYVVGSKKMTDGIRETLKDKGIKRSNIKKDTFFGY